MPLRPKEPGFEFVYVENDGSARELDEEEQEYLKTEFHGGDGNRPYIKDRYSQLTPDNKMHGYILRTRVPKSIEIKAVDHHRLT